MAQGLREEAYTVDIASDRAAALELSRVNSFDVILLDVMLPGISGLYVARQIRCRKQDIAVLMLTARDAVPPMLSHAGADDYLTKPFFIS